MLNVGFSVGPNIGAGRKELLYSSQEHITLLTILQSTPDSFNSSEGCDEWRTA
jgi:hypothetical protein